MSHLRLILVTLFIGGLTIFCGGCGSSLSLSGNVTYNGTPVAKGAITLTPADGKGPAVGGEIVDGKYTIKEILPGIKIVQIVSVKETNMAMSSAEMAQRASQPRGAKNEAADLIPPNALGNNQQFEVTSTTREHNFDLKSPQ